VVAFDLAARPEQMRARLSAEIDFAIFEIDRTIYGCNFERRHTRPRASTKVIP
jgi:hypothetical protein